MKSANWISGHRPQAGHGRADGHADDHRLGQRRVQHAVAAELVVQPVGGEEDAALLAHVLAEHDDRLVAAHLLRAASSRTDSMRVMTATALALALDSSHAGAPRPAVADEPRRLPTADRPCAPAARRA